MPGEIKKLLDAIIDTRAQGNLVIAQATRTKIILKGIYPSHHTEDSEDDPEILARVREIAGELDVSLIGSL